ncbi:MAG: hypothetical protein FJY85_02985 [Deltaproteobacteria bacterium]|nr:hypothetical protein [Deltaproteobacteria bacterium]
MSENQHMVKIEFKRVQEFLFEVPRLRYMLGANVLLGEYLRVELPKLARECGAVQSTDVAGKAPKRDPNDPLDLVKGSEDLADDPDALFQKGILVRDAGRFHTVFPSPETAATFVRRVKGLVASKLPGLRIQIRSQAFSETRDSGEDHHKGTDQPQSLLDLPVFQVCQELGNEPATHEKKDPDRNRPIYYSARARSREEAAQRFDTPEGTFDVVGLLKRQEKLPLMKSKDRDGPRTPQDFRELCSSDYLAVVHADGNDMGARFREWTNKKDGQHASPWDRETYGEEFFHGARVAVRRALVDSLKETFSSFVGRYRPYEVLMLGGDDLLVVCRAKYALGLVCTYAKHLQEHSLPDARPVTIGAGVAIASPNFPFHHLHRLAEDLAVGAKRLYRQYEANGHPCSVVDWLVCTHSWADDPYELRRRHLMTCYEGSNGKEELALTGRPYPILGDGVDSLQGLLAKAKELEKGSDNDSIHAARSQLRHLVSQLGKGRLWANLCFGELPEATKGMLKKVGVESPWVDAADQPGRWKTHLFDLVDIYEIQRLQVKSLKSKEHR